MSTELVTYAVCHLHQYGSTAYLIKGPSDLLGMAGASPAHPGCMEKIVKQLKINYEPDKGESLEIDSVNVNNIPVLEL